MENLKDIIEGMFASDIHEGMFDVEDTVDRVGNDMAIENWIRSYGTKSNEKFITYHDNKVEWLWGDFPNIDSSLIKSFPGKNPLTLIKNNGRVEITDLKKGELNKLTSHIEAFTIWISSSEINDCVFTGKNISLKNDSVVSKCVFEKFDWLTFSDNGFNGKVFKSCKFNTKDDNCQVDVLLKKCPQDKIFERLSKILKVDKFNADDLRRGGVVYKQKMDLRALMNYFGLSGLNPTVVKIEIRSSDQPGISLCIDNNYGSIRKI